jgi:hypothetical protein
MSISEIAPQSATVVPDERRQDFLPTLFRRSLLIAAENAVYSFMERLSPLDYGGGFWDFYEHQETHCSLRREPKRVSGSPARSPGFRGKCPLKLPGLSSRFSPSRTCPSSISPSVSGKATVAFTSIRRTIQKLRRYFRRSTEKPGYAALGWRTSAFRLHCLVGRTPRRRFIIHLTSPHSRYNLPAHARISPRSF